MNTLDWINTTVVALGIPVIITTLIFMGRKLQVLEDLKTEVEVNIRPDIKEVRERLALLEGKTANMFEANSPISLTQKGKRFLNQSSLKEYIDKNTKLLTSCCAEESEMKTPYDVQQAVFELFDNYTLPENVENKIKSLAFHQGLSVGVARRVGAIYFRNIMLKNLGFKPEDLDGK